MSKFEHLQKWAPNGASSCDSSANYAGLDLSEYYVALGKTRDSDLLGQSNFHAFVRALKDKGFEQGEPDDYRNMENNPQCFEILSFGHWACGWYEQIFIHETQDKVLAAAEALGEQLSDYPVLDEEDFSNREWEAASEYWKSLSLRERIDYCGRDGCSIFAARHDELPSCGSGEIISMLAE